MNGRWRHIETPLTDSDIYAVLELQIVTDDSDTSSRSLVLKSWLDKKKEKILMYFYKLFNVFIFVIFGCPKNKQTEKNSVFKVRVLKSNTTVI